MALTVEEASVAYEPAMRNVQPAGDGVCVVCHQLIDPAYSRCYSCQGAPHLLDAVAPITYSEHLGQMHTALRTYKNSLPQNERYAAVRLTAILWRFLESHERCVARATGVEKFDLVTTVPSSSPERDAAGPLRRIVDWCKPIKERHARLLTPTGSVPDGERGFSTDRYRATEDVDAADVLLIDDTWTTGGHAQSAAATLKSAGASRVAAVVIGRHFRGDYPVGEETSKDRFESIPLPFDWETCAMHQSP
jgi:predicted amidophosphoribosyltransferase